VTHPDPPTRFVDRRVIVVTAVSVAIVTVVVIAVALASGFVADQRSCERSAVSRLALRDYAVAAAVAREHSAWHERHSDPFQARIDTAAAAEFRVQAGKVPTLDCSTFPAQK
jgi:hypothetical protein